MGLRLRTLKPFIQGPFFVMTKRRDLRDTDSVRPDPVSLLILVPDTVASVPPEEVLLHKMIQAMSLRPNEYRIQTLAEFTLSPLPFLRAIAFGKSLKLRLDSTQAQVFCTFSPAELIENPSLKKQAWDDLKTVLKQLGK